MPRRRIGWPQIQDIEGKLAQFKRRNAGRLPDSSVVNMQLAERTGSELMRIEREISTLQDARIALEAQMPVVRAQTSARDHHRRRTRPVTDGTTAHAASAIRKRVRSVRRRSPRYPPDAAGNRRAQRRDGTSDKEATRGQLKKLEAELAALRERYSEDHPDIQRLKRSIAALKASGVKQTTCTSGRKSPAIDSARRPDNPAYIALTTQIEGVKRELNQLAVLRDDLRAQQRTYDARLMQIPEIEREYHDLTRDYENAQTRYREVKAKQMQAEVSQELEKDRKAERFSLGEPAHLPERPVSPNRPAIVLIGVIAALGGGFGLAWLREAFDTSVKGPLELARIATGPDPDCHPLHRDALGASGQAAPDLDGWSA